MDLFGLTKAEVREIHQTLDCVDGYHGVPLAKEDKHKTVFITEDGRFETSGIWSIK